MEAPTFQAVCLFFFARPFSGMEPANSGATMLKRKQRRVPSNRPVSAAPFLCTINVRLTKPLEATKEPGARVDFLVGYYRNIGVRAAGIPQLKTLLTGYVHDGEIVWDDTVVHDFDGVEQNIAERFIDRDTSPIWYASGRIFYPGGDRTN
jgi:hypothetical protein